MRYKAFISYSHVPDGHLAEALQTALQRFAKPWNKMRALNVFRDLSSLSADPSLWASIERALRDAEFFILLASPQSAQSPWVLREITYWVEQRDIRHLLIVLTDGEIVWDAPMNDFDWQATTALPKLLAGRMDQPLYVDLRSGRDPQALSLKHPVFLDKVADLAATLHGVPKDEISGRQVREHRKTMRLAWAARLGLGILAVTATVFGIIAEGRRREAIQRLIDFYVEQGRQEFLSGNLSRAAIVLSQAYSLGGDGPALKYLLARAIEPLASLAFVRPGDHGAIQFWAVSPDSGRLVTVTQSGGLTAWDVTSGRELFTVRLDEAIRGLAFSRDGNVLVASDVSTDRVRTWDAFTGAALDVPPPHVVVLWTNGNDIPATRIGNLDATRIMAPPARGMPSKAIALLDARDEHLVNELSSPSGSFGVVFNPSGSVAYTARGSDVRVWDAATGAVLLDLPAVYEYTVAAVDRHARRIALGGDRTSSVLVHALPGGETLVSLPGHSGGVESLDFSPDGRYLLVGGHGDARVWDVDTGTLTTALYADSATTEARFSPDGARIFTKHADGSLRSWYVPGALPWLLDTGANGLGLGAIVDVRQAGDEQWLIVAERGAVVWRPRQNKHVGLARSSDRLKPGEVHISPDGKRVVLGSTLHTLPTLDVIADLGSASLGALPFTSDGTRLVTAGRPPAVWEVSTGSRLFELTRPATSASFDPKGVRIVTASSFEGPLDVWDAQDGTHVASIPVSRLGDANPVHFSRDGSRFAAVADGDPIVVDTASGVVLHDPKPPAEAVRRRRSKQLFFARPDPVTLVGWDLDTQRAVLRIPAVSPPQNFATMVNTYHESPGGRYLLVTYGDIIWTPLGAPKVWSLETGALVSSLEGHTDLIQGGMFSPSGDLVLTHSRDGGVSMWAAHSGAELQRLKRPRPATAAFLDNGGTMAIWDGPEARLFSTRLETRSADTVSQLVCRHSGWRLIEGRLTAVAQQTGGEQPIPCRQD